MQDEEIKNERARWEQETLKKAVERYPEREEQFTTYSGIPIKQIYTPEDVEGINYTEDIGFPGEYPYTRGIQATMYRGRLWTMRQLVGFNSIEETKARQQEFLDQGVISVAISSGSCFGGVYDSDDPLMEGLLGQGTTVARDTLQDTRDTMEGFDLEQVSVNFPGGQPTAVIDLAKFLVVAEEHGTPFNLLRGTLQNDTLSMFISNHYYEFPVKHAMRLMVDIIKYSCENLPQFNPISISPQHQREAGATAVQEVAISFCNAISYVQACIDAGMDVDTFAPRFSWNFGVYMDLFEEAAKFRAARRVWARIMKERFGAKNPRSWMLRVHAQTSGSALMAPQPENNIMRVTIQALAAVLGGVNSLHTDGFDEPLAIPTERAARLAIRTQQIIAHESGAAKVVDPLAGSYYVESLTNQIEEEVSDFIKKVDDMGGAETAVENGFFQQEIARSAYAHQMAVERKERIIVGVNDFKVEQDYPVEVFEADQEAGRKHLEKLRRIKEDRDKDQLRQSLEKLKGAAGGDENLVPYTMEAVKAMTTTGEIIEALREVFGTYTKPATF